MAGKRVWLLGEEAGTRPASAARKYKDAYRLNYATTLKESTALKWTSLVSTLVHGSLSGVISAPEVGPLPKHNTL